MTTDHKFVIAITTLFIAGITLFFWRGEAQLAFQDALGDPAITGTWVQKEMIHQGHESIIFLNSFGKHFEGESQMKQRRGDWRFELEETTHGLLIGTAYWEISNMDGSHPLKHHGHLSGVVLDGGDVAFILEVPPHKHSDEGAERPLLSFKYALKYEDGHLVGYGLGNGVISMFATKVDLERVPD